jgi:hypothetical protein
MVDEAVHGSSDWAAFFLVKTKNCSVTVAGHKGAKASCWPAMGSPLPTEPMSAGHVRWYVPGVPYIFKPPTGVPLSLSFQMPTHWAPLRTA